MKSCVFSVCYSICMSRFSIIRSWRFRLFLFEVESSLFLGLSLVDLLALLEASVSLLLAFMFSLLLYIDPYASFLLDSVTPATKI